MGVFLQFRHLFAVWGFLLPLWELKGLKEPSGTTEIFVLINFGLVSFFFPVLFFDSGVKQYFLIMSLI